MPQRLTPAEREGLPELLPGWRVLPDRDAIARDWRFPDFGTAWGFLSRVALLAERPTTTVLVTHDVEEALLLGDRLCLLSNRPARVVDEQPVPFGRDRGRAVLSDPGFVRMKAAVLERVLAA